MVLKPIAGTVCFFAAAIATAWIAKSAAPPTNYTVNRAGCSCDCFDRQLKAGYFNAANQYRFMYINYEVESLLLLIWTGFYAYMILTAASHIAGLMWRRRLSLLVLTAFLFNCYGQQYNWGSTWNYVNDHIYHLFATQMFFVVTEWLPTITLFYLLDAQGEDKERLPRHWVLASQAVSLCHIFASLEDQGFRHIFRLEPVRWGIVLRDSALLLSDAVPFVVVYYCMWDVLRSRWNSAGIVAGALVLWGFYLGIKFIFGY